eukprot:188809-Hanusia_phi.AAC.1
MDSDFTAHGVCVQQTCRNAEQAKKSQFSHEHGRERTSREGRRNGGGERPCGAGGGGAREGAGGRKAVTVMFVLKEQGQGGQRDLRGGGR